MVVTDKGKVLKPISTREKPVSAREEAPAKERWRAAATKGGKRSSTSENSAKESVNKGKVEKTDHVKKEEVNKEEHYA